jgi:hypothetical protein
MSLPRDSRRLEARAFDHLRMLLPLLVACVATVVLVFG